MLFKFRIAVIDLELTCDDVCPVSVEDHEIIEIGICVCDVSNEDVQVIAEKQFYVQPVMNPILTKFCTHLTGIQQVTVNDAIVLAEVLPQMKSWLVKNDVSMWGSWGNDRRMFETECRLKALENPLKEFVHFDVKKIFSQTFGWRVGMTRALSLRGVEQVGRLHSAIDDAKNVVNLIKHERILRAAIIGILKGIAKVERKPL